MIGGLGLAVMNDEHGESRRLWYGRLRVIGWWLLALIALLLAVTLIR